MYVSPFDSLMILWWQILGLSQIDGVVVQAYVLPVYTRRVIHVHVPLKKKSGSRNGLSANPLISTIPLFQKLYRLSREVSYKKRKQ